MKGIWMILIGVGVLFDVTSAPAAPVFWGLIEIFIARWGAFSF